MSRSDVEAANLALVRRIYDEVLGPLDPDAVDRFFRPDYVQHSAMAETGAAGLKRFLTWARGHSPLATHDVKRLFADGAFVIAHVHVVLRPGQAGNAVVDIFRIEDGLAAEHWDVAQPVPATSSNGNGMF